MSYPSKKKKKKDKAAKILSALSHEEMLES